jgi:predicted transcriptional regulator
MERLNLTLDSDTSKALQQHAARTKKPRATVARELIREALARRDRIEQRRRLARDYAAGRADNRKLLGEMEQAQLDLVED